MAEYNVYGHNNLNVEEDMFYVCTCDSMETAKFVVDALDYKETLGGKLETVNYKYYIFKKLEK